MATAVTPAAVSNVPAPVVEDDRDRAPEPAKLSRGALSRLSTMVSDVRGAVSRLRGSSRRSLEILYQADAVPAMRELYYELQREDPNDAMPVRRVLGDWHFAQGCIIPILKALRDVPSSPSELRRWIATLYQTLRLVSMLCVPIEEGNTMLSLGCNIEAQMMDVKHAFATSPKVLTPLVSLLQHYLQKKAESTEAFRAAEDSKVEDARIENIMRFFRNLLTPPRKGVDRDLMRLDRGVHLALVGAVVQADLFATIGVLFCDAADARNLHTPIVLLSSEMYSLVLRHSNPREVAMSALRARHGAEDAVVKKEQEAVDDVGAIQPSVFGGAEGTEGDGGDVAQASDKPGLPSPKPPSKNPGGISTARPSGLRAAMMRERSLVGGGRSVVASTRWSTRYSGGFHQVVSRKETSSGQGRDGNLPVAGSRVSKSLASKRIVSAKGVSSSTKSGIDGVVQNSMQLNSNLICLFGSSGLRPRIASKSKRSTIGRAVRLDLVRRGQFSLCELLQDLIKDCFPVLIRELHDRILDAKNKASQADIWVGRRYYMSLVSFTAGFQREFATIAAQRKDRGGASSKSLLDSRFQDGLFVHEDGLVVDWRTVEDAVSLESFRLVLDAILDARGTGRQYASELELATAALKEMMKLLHWMSVSAPQREVAKKAVPDEEALRAGESQPTPMDKCTESTPLVIKMGPKHAPTTSGENREDAESDTEIEKQSDDAIEADTGPEKQRKDATESDAGLEKRNDDAADAATVAPKTSENSTDFTTENVNTGPEEAPEETTKDPNATSTATPSPAPQLTSREFALNTLEDLFEREIYLDAPAMLAREFDSKLYGFSHLANVIEIAFTFTTTLQERDFAHIRVSKRKRKRRKKKAPVSKPKDAGEGDDVPSEKGNDVPTEKVDDSPNWKGDEGPTAEGISIFAEEKINNLPESGPKDTSEREEPTKEAHPEEGVNSSKSPVEGSPQVTADEVSPQNHGEKADEAPTVPDDEEVKLSESESEVDDGFVGEYKVEGEEVIRRFASPKALQHIAYALRCALCGVTGICSTLLPIPEGSPDILRLPIVAKSLAVLQAIWKIVGMRERGAFRFAFYNYAMLHLLGSGMAVAKRRVHDKSSVLGVLDAFSASVISEFYTALQTNPVLLVDSLFLTDMGTQRQYSAKMYQVAMMKREEDARLCGDYVGSDEEPARDVPERKRRRKQPGRTAARRAWSSDDEYSSDGLPDLKVASRSRRRDTTEDSADVVDDIDNLDLVPKRDDSGSDTGSDRSSSPRPAKKRKGRRKRAGEFIVPDGDSYASSSSESEDEEDEKKRKPRARRSAKPKPASKDPASKNPASKNSAKPNAPEFSSNDEYEDDEFEAVGVNTQTMETVPTKEQDTGPSNPAAPQVSSGVTAAVTKNRVKDVVHVPISSVAEASGKKLSVPISPAAESSEKEVHVPILSEPEASDEEMPAPIASAAEATENEEHAPISSAAEATMKDVRVLAPSADEGTRKEVHVPISSMVEAAKVAGAPSSKIQELPRTTGESSTGGSDGEAQVDKTKTTPMEQDDGELSGALDDKPDSSRTAPRTRRLVLSDDSESD